MRGSHVAFRHILRDKVFRGSGDAVVIGPSVHSRQVLAPVAVHWRSIRRLPFQRGSAPWIGVRFFAPLQAADDVYEKQYIEFAKSYSFSEYRIATKYALKPASIPTVTIIGLDFAFMLGNAFLVETVFVWPGMAKYGVEVILAKDLNGIIATALVITTFFLIINMIVDFVVLLLNPRITTKD